MANPPNYPRISVSLHYKLLNTHMTDVLDTVAALGNVADAEDAFSYATADSAAPGSGGYAAEDLKGWTYVFDHLVHAGLLARDPRCNDDFVLTTAGELLRRPR